MNVLDMCYRWKQNRVKSRDVNTIIKIFPPSVKVTTIYHCICPTQNSSDSVYFFIFCFLHKLSSVILYPTRIRILPHVQCFVPRKACPLLENTGASMYIQWPMVVFYLFFSLSQSSVVNSLWLQQHLFKGLEILLCAYNYCKASIFHIPFPYLYDL